MRDSKTGKTTQAYLALAAICIIWGTTYTAIKYAIGHFPPYLLVGIRQTSGGLILLLWLLLLGKLAATTPRYLFLQAIAGIFTITGGNGLITYGMLHVSSGLAAVVGSMTPIVVVIINIIWKNEERIHWQTVLGILLGFGGLTLIFQEGYRDFARPEYRLGLLMCLGSCFTWSLGTVMAKRWNDIRNLSPLQNAGLQLTFGGLCSFVLSIFFDHSHQIHHSWMGWLAVLYLSVVGSAIAFTFYMYTLQHLSATVSSLYTYINPIVAIILGALFLQEQVSWIEAIGMAITIFGVWLVNQNR